MTVSLIAAMGENRVLGHKGDIPWKVPEDVRFFKETTLGHAIIMGRKTWETMYRPLPKRRNIVVTRRSDYRADGAEVVPDVARAIALGLETDPDPFVIGGGEIYTLAIPVAQRMYITLIPEKPPGDAFFPEFSLREWREVARRQGEAAGVVFFTYERIQ